VLVSRTRRPMGAQGHYKGRKPSYSRKQYESAKAMLGKSASVGEVARSTSARTMQVWRGGGFAKSHAGTFIAAEHPSQLRCGLTP
jgi:hypothetical protein